jgi:hypothetical protein
MCSTSAELQIQLADTNYASAVIDVNKRRQGRCPGVKIQETEFHADSWLPNSLPKKMGLKPRPRKTAFLIL